MNVGDWLRSLELGQYEGTFRDNEIDETVLPALTMDDLKELGIVAVGHRRKLHSAIAHLSLGLAGPSALAATPTETRSIPDSAERRQLTLMFCDLVGSTAMSARLDPEDMRGIIAAYQKCCAGLIASNGGFVAKYMGDGVLAYFGYPLAHEHDAERAVRAGLAIVAAAPRLQTPAAVPQHVRIGIATGIVVVGDLLGSGESHERGVVGDTPNLAARLQSIAGPDSVVIAESTRKLLGNLFELDDLGPQDLKGVAGPARVFAARREISQESRFEALHVGPLTALVGREEETELLFRRWKKATAGHGQVAVISGEAGIGKSRLTAALLERLASESHSRLRYSCSPQHADSPLHPVIAQLERAAGFLREDDAEAKLDKLDGLLARCANSRQYAPSFADLLSLPNNRRYSALDPIPQLRRQKTLDALIWQIEEISRQTPLLMIFEDAHWGDPSSLELLGRLIDRLTALRVLLFVTCRPEFVPPWIGHPHVVALTINRLTPPEVRALIARIVGDKELADTIKQDIVERADGIPLFVEEMTKAVLEAKSENQAATTIAGSPSRVFAVPASLHASLMARLDRLGSAKAVAQVGAAIGREFSHALLSNIADLPESELESALNRLVDGGLLFRQGVPPDATYLFKHVLVQDAAYGALLREPRRQLHRRIAETLEAQFPEIAESQPELLARHCVEAALIQKALNLWDKAGERAMSRSAYSEAIAHLKKALDLLESPSEKPASPLLELRLQTSYGYAQMHARGLTSPEARAAFARARELAVEVEDVTERFSAYYGLWAGSWARTELEPMREIAEFSLRDAQSRPGSPEASVANRLSGSTCLFEGDYVRARSHFEAATAVYDYERDRRHADRFGYDIGAAATMNLAFTLLPLGDFANAISRLDSAITLAIATEHVPTIALAHAAGCLFWSTARRPEKAREHGDIIRELGQKHSMHVMLAFGQFFVGWARCKSDKTEAELEMREGLELARRASARVYMPFYWSLVAEIEADRGRVDSAEEVINQQLAIIEQTGERTHYAEALRLRGEILLRKMPFDPEEGEATLISAVKTARSQGTRLFELRATLSLAEHYRVMGRDKDARGLVEQEMFGFDRQYKTWETAEADRLLLLLCGEVAPLKQVKHEG